MIAVGAGASGCLNMWWDADIDALMTRTAKRPIPDGRIRPDEALAFGIVLSVGSVLILGLASNWLAAGLLAFTIVFYAVIYSMWLKRATAQNIVIGGAAGALPPVVGQAAVTGHVGLESLILFAIIFIWTPPHFWALALVKSGEYAKAGIPMMPNVAGPDSTRRQIVWYTLLLAPLGLAPVLFGFGGWLYALVGVLGGLGMLAGAVQVFRLRQGESERKAAMGLFAFSILYLFLLFRRCSPSRGSASSARSWFEARHERPSRRHPPADARRGAAPPQALAGHRADARRPGDPVLRADDRQARTAGPAAAALGAR